MKFKICVQSQSRDDHDNVAICLWHNIAQSSYVFFQCVTRGTVFFTYWKRLRGSVGMTKRPCWHDKRGYLFPMQSFSWNSWTTARLLRCQQVSRLVSCRVWASRKRCHLNDNKKPMIRPAQSPNQKLESKYKQQQQQQQQQKQQQPVSRMS